jgi:hypothetical protein
MLYALFICNNLVPTVFLCCPAYRLHIDNGSSIREDAMIEDQFTNYGYDHILLPDEFLEEVLPDFHADQASLLVELQQSYRMAE